VRRFSLVLVPTVLAACLSTTDSSLSLGPTDANVAGSFSLASINGQGLPVIANQTTTQEFDLTGDTISIASTGTWTETSVYNVTTFSSNTVSVLVTAIGGTYTIANQQINFVQTTGGGSSAFAGSVHTNQLTLVFGGSQFIYVRSG
jgi:hypothetical protein